MEWVQRYERVERYNRWGEADCRETIMMYLEGAAAKWYAYLEAVGNVPLTWCDTNGGRGLRTVFLSKFKPADYGRFQENRRRNRKQGFEEPITEYNIEVLDMCGKVDL